MIELPKARYQAAAAAVVFFFTFFFLSYHSGGVGKKRRRKKSKQQVISFPPPSSHDIGKKATRFSPRLFTANFKLPFFLLSWANAKAQDHFLIFIDFFPLWLQSANSIPELVKLENRTKGLKVTQRCEYISI